MSRIPSLPMVVVIIGSVLGGTFGLDLMKEMVSLRGDNVRTEDENSKRSSSRVEDATTWCYEKDGCKQGDRNSDWEKGLCKLGRRQSPIDLNTSLTLPSSSKTLFATTLDISDVVDQYNFKTYRLINDGFTVKVIPDKMPQFHWKELNTSYKLAQIHFHHGPNDKVGSEHTFSGKSYAMEVHLVHVSSKYGTIQDALPKLDPRGLAVIGFLMEVGSTTDSFLKPIVDKLVSDKLTEVGKEIKVTSKTGQALDIVPPLKNQTEVYTYEGSLTTPAGEYSCAEQVAWIVGRTPVTVTKEDVQAFRKILHKVKYADGTEETYPATNTYRKLQDLNDREVRVIQFETCSNSSTVQ